MLNELEVKFIEDLIDCAGELTSAVSEMDQVDHFGYNSLIGRTEYVVELVKMILPKLKEPKLEPISLLSSERKQDAA